MGIRVCVLVRSALKNSNKHQQRPPNMDTKGTDQSIYTIHTDNPTPVGFSLEARPPAAGFNLDGNSTAPSAENAPGIGYPEPMVLSPQQLPPYPGNPPEYSPPAPGYQYQPSDYPQQPATYIQPQIIHQPGIQHNYAEGATITPVVITVSRSEEMLKGIDFHEVSLHISGYQS